MHLNYICTVINFVIIPTALLISFYNEVCLQIDNILILFFIFCLFDKCNFYHISDT